MIVPLKSFQIAQKANICGMALVPNEVVGLTTDTALGLTRITWLCELGAILCEREGRPDDLISFSHVVKATPLVDLKPDLFGKGVPKK